MKNDDLLDHAGLITMKKAHPEWIWNRSDTHVFLGVPQSPETFKTVVEPGNSFSPGFGSYGVSTWVSTSGDVFAPELANSDALRWRYQDGYLPILTSTWAAGDIDVVSRLQTGGDAELRKIRTDLALSLHNPTEEVVEAEAHILVRSFGPAGGPIRTLEFADRDVLVNGGVMMTMSSSPDTTYSMSVDADGSDVGAELLRGTCANSSRAEDSEGWASGSANFAVVLEPGQTWKLQVTCFVHANHPHLPWLHREVGLPHERVDEDSVLSRWQADLPMQLSLPDPRYGEALKAQLVYLAMCTVGAEPRITPVSYPLWWLRDGSYVINALNRGGYRPEWVSKVVEGVAGREPFGGFGAEGDGPAQLIWLISEQFLLSRDREQLERLFPQVVRQANRILEMMAAGAPIFGRTEIRTPEMMLSPDADLMSLPARDGLIAGRMDHHFPVFWINGWAALALRRASLCARELGLDGSRFDAAAEVVVATLRDLAPTEFGNDERDFTSALWPTGWATSDNDVVRHRFDEFWDTVRVPNGVYRPEPEWTYFEVGQAHNYLLLGERERALATVEQFLTHHAAQGLYTYHEGIGDENSSLQWQRARGWDSIAFVTPHGWTAAELALLLRDGLIREDGDDLVIGSLIPEWWCGQDFAVSSLPSHFGLVDFVYESVSRSLSVVTDRAPSSVRSDFPVDVTVATRVRAVHAETK